MIDSMLDQAIPLPQQRILQSLDEIHVLVENAVRVRDDGEIIDEVLNLRVAAQVRGVTLASLLYEWRKNSRVFGVDPEDWEDHVFVQTGYSRQTIRKYVDVWEAISAAPKEFFNALLGKPMEGLLRLPAAVREGQLDEEDWEKIAGAPDIMTIRDVVREARGKATSSETAIRISCDRNGMLHVWQADSHDVIGYLKPQNEMLHDFSKAAAARIINAAGIFLE